MGLCKKTREQTGTEQSKRKQRTKAEKTLAVLVVAAALYCAGFFCIYTPAREALVEGVCALFGLEVQDADALDIYELSPMDEEGQKRVQQAQPIDSDDTWTICYYMVGSNLEDMDENDLSQMTQLLTQEKLTENQENAENALMEQISSYAKELAENGLDFPEYLYEPVRPEASSEPVTEDVVVADIDGMASEDIGEICNGVSSDKINVIIQTGGATRWSNARINPNKTQRFLVKDGNLEEIENMPLQDSCSVDTLADFLTFCDENYPADHRMVVLWDHGGGASGYGKDDIFGSSMSLKDIQEAFSRVCEADPDDPHYDIIGFDACLMASLETAHTLYGYGRYLVGSEETEPGAGWSHDSYLQAMSEDPTMSPAAIGEKIADSFVDFYMEKNCGILNMPFYSITTSFSLIDLNKAEETYQSYCALNERLLEDAVKNNSVLTKIGSAAQNATRLAGETYEIYNLIDLGNYMEALAEVYPKECEAVLTNLKEAVVYHRGNGYLSEATGINVYMPVSISRIEGLYFFLPYVENVCDDMATRALYYYKISGCLNQEYQEYVEKQGYGKAKTIDTASLEKLRENTITIYENGFGLTLNKKQKENYQSARLEVARYVEEEEQVISYGQSSQLTEEDGVISADFGGKWICLDGQPLYVEVVSETQDSIAYRSPVTINDENYYLLFSYDRGTDEVKLNGASIYNANAEADASAAHVIGKTTISLEAGDVIKPVYDVYDPSSNSGTRQESEEEIIFGESSQITVESLPDGNYLNAIVLTDIRGDSYYSDVVEQTIEDGVLQSQEISKEFVGSNY